MSTWCYYCFDEFCRYLPMLLITDVPDGETVTEDVIKRAGCSGEGGLLEIGKTYDVIKLDVNDSPAELVGCIRRGKTARITYPELMKRANAPL